MTKTKKKNLKQALWEAAKEVLRLLVLSVPALLIQVLTGDSLLTGTVGTVSLFLLRGLDSYIHNNPSINKSGLLPF